MSDGKNTDWVREFSRFIESVPIQPSAEVKDRLFNRVNRDLNPSLWRVFAKVSCIQAVVGFLTLLFCPQFGFSLTGVHGIMHVLMRYGEVVCMFGCGTVFAAGSLLLSAFSLSVEETRILRKNEILQVALLGLLAIGVFLCLGAEVWELFTLAWFSGYIAGGIATLELGWMGRRWIKERVARG